MNSSLLVWLHVLMVFGLVSGLIGRAVSFSRAGRAQDLGALRTLAGLGFFFDGVMVRPIACSYC